MTGHREEGRVYTRDVLRGVRVPHPTAEACHEVAKIMHAHERPMSFTLIRSRTMPLMPAVLLAACLEHMLEHDLHISLTEHDLFELETLLPFKTYANSIIEARP